MYINKQVVRHAISVWGNLSREKKVKEKKIKNLLLLITAKKVCLFLLRIYLFSRIIIIFESDRIIIWDFRDSFFFLFKWVFCQCVFTWQFFTSE